MRQFDEYFSTEISKTLFHYTSISALTGIAETKSLWASNVYFMNDSAEITHACDLLEHVLDSNFISGDLVAEEIEFIRQFREWLGWYRHTRYNIFVFSLSEEPSLLSQWRSYTPHGKGVSIGFSSAFLKTISQSSNLKIAKCLYKKSEKEDVLHSLVEKLLDTFRRDKPISDISKAHPSQCYHPFLENFRQDVLQVLTIIKHPAFEEEREWRLISPYYAVYTVPSIKFRQGASMLVPYIEFLLGESKPYFEKVILGPSPHQNLSMNALSMFLRNQKLCQTTENCSIPYREW